MLVLLALAVVLTLASCAPTVSPPPTPMPTAEPLVGSDLIELPAGQAQVTLPIHVLARVGMPGQTVLTELRWQDGTSFENEHVLLEGEDGQGLLLANVDWGLTGQRPPQPPTQPAVLMVKDGEDSVLAQQLVLVLAPDDPDTMTVTLYWFWGETLQPEQRPIPRTTAVGTAALEELLWGPPPGRLAGYTTALPTPDQVLSYPGRTADWGPMVTLRGLAIEDGVATADFSRELEAYGGGSARVMQIQEQVTRTLLQFPTVQEVRIAIEGRVEGALQP